MIKHTFLTKKFLIKQYLIEKKSTIKIAQECNIWYTIICYYLKKYNIKMRTRSEALKGKSKTKVLKNKLSKLAKIRYKNPKNHPSYKQGYCSDNKPKCMDCDKEISYGHKRCKKCHYVFNKMENHSCWNGGTSFEPYNIMFTRKLKESIRKRDNYTCQRCGIKQKNYRRKLDVHHIDYNKKNCKENNLISLCWNCNSKVNYNRKIWKKYFKQIIRKLYKLEE